ncbi:MAG: hypothetical protein LBO62_06405 [Endomicrobium sp.]|jgi:hypothetical protein|nr:hypothetical protein [Endomicrobium sp.]
MVYFLLFFLFFLIVVSFCRKAYRENKNSLDYHSMSMHYYSLALQHWREHRNPNECLRVSAMYRLKRFQESDIKKVEISCVAGCANCNKAKKIYSIKEALKSTPIPNISCKFNLHNEGLVNGIGFCRCIYIPIIS